MTTLRPPGPFPSTHQERHSPITVEDEILGMVRDHHGSITTFFDVLRDHAWPRTPCRAISLTPWPRHEHEHALQPGDDPIKQAQRLVIHMSMSRNDRFTCPSRHLPARWTPGTTSRSQWQAMPQTHDRRQTCSTDLRHGNTTGPEPP